MIRRMFLASLMVFGLCGIARADAIADINAIKAEVTASTLGPSYKTLLNQVLSSAITRVNQGNNAAAVSLLHTFEAYVQRFVDAGALDPVTGALWIAQAEAVVAEL